MNDSTRLSVRIAASMASLVLAVTAVASSAHADTGDYLLPDGCTINWWNNYTWGGVMEARTSEVSSCLAVRAGIYYKAQTGLPKIVGIQCRF